VGFVVHALDRDEIASAWSRERTRRIYMGVDWSAGGGALKLGDLKCLILEGGELSAKLYLRITMLGTVGKREAWTYVTRGVGARLNSLQEGKVGST